MKSHAKSAAEAPATANTDFQLAEFTGSLSSQLLLQAKGPAGGFLDSVFVFPARALLLASEMASVTLEVKINNQSCKQRKRRGRS